MRHSKSTAAIGRAQVDLQDILGRRLDALQNSYGITGLTRWDQHITGYNGTNVDALLTDPTFAPLMRTNTVAAYELGTKQRLLCDLNHKLIEVLSLPDRIIFRNPLYNDILESWARPRWASSLQYHGSVAKTTHHKSTFKKGIDGEAIALAAFAAPIGRLRAADHLMLYFQYSESVGTLAGSGQATDLVRIDCVRTPRKSGGGSKPLKANGSPKKLGYETQIHAYPCSQSEVNQELKKCPRLHARV